MRIIKYATLIAFIVSGQLACRSTEIAVEDYDQTCTRNADCAIASFGDACDACLAEQDAVNVGAIASITADTEEATAVCPPWSERFHVECVAALPQVAPVCLEGRCTIPSSGAPCTFDAGSCRGVDP